MGGDARWIPPRCFNNENLYTSSGAWGSLWDPSFGLKCVTFLQAWFNTRGDTMDTTVLMWSQEHCSCAWFLEVYQVFSSFHVSTHSSLDLLLVGILRSTWLGYLVWYILLVFFCSFEILGANRDFAELAKQYGPPELRFRGSGNLYEPTYIAILQNWKNNINFWGYSSRHRQTWSYLANEFAAHASLYKHTSTNPFLQTSPTSPRWYSSPHRETCSYLANGIPAYLYKPLRTHLYKSISTNITYITFITYISTNPPPSQSCKTEKTM